MLIGVVAHTDHTIGQVAEHTAAVLARDHREAPGTDGVTLLCTEEGIDLRLLDGDLQLIVIRVKYLHDAVDLHAGVVLVAQIGNGGVAHLPLSDIQIMAVAVHKAAPRADSQHPAFDTGSDTVQIFAVSEKIPLAAVCKPAGTNGEAAFALHLDDNKVDGGAHHILQHVVRALLALFPHFRSRDHDAHTVRHHDGTVHGFLFALLSFGVPDIDGKRVHADNRGCDGAAATIRGIDGVPFLPLLRGQMAVQLVKLQLKELLPVTLGRLDRRRRFRFRS